MLLKYKIIVALAVIFLLTNSYADELKDPADFIKDSFAVLNTVQEECQKITDDLKSNGEIYDSIIKSKVCGEKLFKISSEASIYDLTQIENSETKETIKLLRNIDVFYKIGEDEKVLDRNHIKLEPLYKVNEIKSYDERNITFSVKEIVKDDYISKGNDVNEINYWWRNVADNVGKYTLKNFFPFIALIQKKAKQYNLSAVEFWYPDYTEETATELEKFIKELQPFYQQLHAYTRFKLLKRYGTGVLKTHSPIPQTLHEQMTVNFWDPVYIEDFPKSNVKINMEEFYLENFMDPKEFVDLAEKFYTSLGFESLDEKFRKEHIISESNCLGYFVDNFANNVALKYCADSMFKNFLNLYEYSGRMYSAVFQKDEPWLYWGDNFYGKIIGRAVRLAVKTKKHQELLKLVPEDKLEQLMETDNVNTAFVDIFDLMTRYVNIRIVTDILSNKIEKDGNKYYWDLFEEYAGVEPPIDRIKESLDLPYALVRDVFANVNLIRDFKVKVHTYDAYAAACHFAEHSGPLNKCTFYENKKVGEAFKQILQTGLKRPFVETIKPLIPDYKNLNTEAILAYFKPTSDWLIRYNQEHNLTTGWDHTKRTFTKRNFFDILKMTINELYDQIVSDLFNKKIEGEEFDGNCFWKMLKTDEAITEITEKHTEFQIKPFDQAVIFALGEYLENVAYNNQRLQNLSIDDSIPIYKDTSDDPVLVPYNPYILSVFQTSKDANELKYYWEEWRDKNGACAKTILLDLFKSVKKAAGILEIPSTKFWFLLYGNDYVDKMEKVIESVKPFYRHLHHYLYEKLVKKNNEKDFSKGSASIPDHFVQQVLAQIWTNESIVEEDFPYHKLPPQDQGVIDKKFDGLQLLKIAEEFYQSLGFAPLEETFWTERVKAKEGIASHGNCRATIFDITPKGYVKYCERVSFRKLLQAHGYLGRVHYAVEKKDLPALQSDSYDLEYPVGEAVILSASTPKHVEKIGLTAGFEVTDEVLLNRLTRMAIQTMFNLHKNFVNTKIVAEYLEGKIEVDQVSKTYWKYMVKYAGIEPPSDRRDDQFDFPFEFYADLVQNHQTRKFDSEVLGYRIYERLCKLSGHEGNLNNCDFFGSIEAGNTLKSLMTLGSSVDQKTILQRLLGDDRDLSAHSMLNYYEPLVHWLTSKLDEHNYPDKFDTKRRI